MPVALNELLFQLNGERWRCHHGLNFVINSIVCGEEPGPVPANQTRFISAVAPAVAEGMIEVKYRRRKLFVCVQYAQTVPCSTHIPEMATQPKQCINIEGIVIGGQSLGRFSPTRSRSP